MNPENSPGHFVDHKPFRLPTLGIEPGRLTGLGGGVGGKRQPLSQMVSFVYLSLLSHKRPTKLPLNLADSERHIENIIQ